MNKIVRKITCYITVMALVVAVYSIQVENKETKAADASPVTNLKVTNYCDWTGKYLIYFDAPAESSGYRVRIDDHTAPLKEISGPGGYITSQDLKYLSVGEHTLSVSNYINKDGVITESAKTTTSFTKGSRVGENCDIPQVYIKASNISNSYHDKADVSVTIVDQDGGSKGLGCTDNDGSHKDSAQVSAYADIVDAKCNIKIRGNSSAGQPKKPWNIKFSSKQGVLGMDKGKKWCLLANSMDKSLMRDMLSYNFGLENGVKYTSQSRYVDVYLNGVYKGNYQMCEPVEAKSGRVDVDAYNAESDDILLEYGTRNEQGVDHFTTDVFAQTFDVNDPEKGDDLTDEQVDAKIQRAKTHLNGFENVLKNNLSDINAIEQYIDVDSFVDHYIANELFKNVDIAFSSTRFYIQDGKLYAGPMWDLDLSSGNAKTSYYRDYYASGDSAKGFYCTRLTWYKELMKNNVFVERLKKRYYDLQYQIQSLYRTDSTEVNSINYLMNRYGGSFARNYTSEEQFGAGWSLRNDDGLSLAGEANWQTWQEPIEFLRSWLSRRNTWLSGEWGVNMDEAYARGKEAAESTKETETPEPTTEAPTQMPTIAPTVLPTEVPTVAPTKAPETKTPTAKPTETSTTDIKTAHSLPGYGKAKMKKPSKAKIKKAKRKSAKKIKVTLKRVKGVSGYEVAVYNKKKAKKPIIKKLMTKPKTTIRSSRFKNKKKLFVKARAFIRYAVYKKYGKWSKVKRVK